MRAQNTAFSRRMPLPDDASYGKLFAYSALAGENLHRRDWCGVLTWNPGEIRFAGGEDAPGRMLLRFTEKTLKYDVVVSDLIAAQGGKILVTFADAQTVVGRSDCMPAIRLENEAYLPGARTIFDGQYAFALYTRKNGACVEFALCRRADAESAQKAAREAVGTDMDALAQAVIDWYCSAPPCPDIRYEKLWYKCLSVNRVNIYSPQDGFERFFTTPDRLPHRHMWLWDSCFHALALVHFAPALAEDAVLAVLDCQREDGFIPHRMKSRDDISDITQPPVLCATIWSLYEVTGDMELLRQTAKKLHRYLQWDLQNRRSPSGLMTWYTQYADVRCRCDESGMDNSPRFDTTEKLEAVDFSTFMVNELLCLRRIYMTIGERGTAMRLEETQRELTDKINERLWDPASGCYYDRTWDGEFRRILTPVSFLPLFAGICDPRQARRLSAHLPPLLDLPFPLPSAVDENGGYFTRDMWRGGVWLNYNYFIYVGLQKYGFGKLASDLRHKTLEGVNKQFLQSGNVYEFYDPFGGDPLRLDRKGPQPETPDALVHMHSITDYNWSACFIELFLRS